MTRDSSGIYWGSGQEYSLINLLPYLSKQSHMAFSTGTRLNHCRLT